MIDGWCRNASPCPCGCGWAVCGIYGEWVEREDCARCVDLDYDPDEEDEYYEEE